MCTIGRTAGGTACKAHHRTDRFSQNLCRVLSWKIPTGKGTISSRGTTTGSCLTPSSDMPI